LSFESFIVKLIFPVDTSSSVDLSEIEEISGGAFILTGKAIVLDSPLESVAVIVTVT
jgi:hypothetical protein